MPSRIGEERGALYGSRREFVWARDERTLQPEFACLEEQRAQGFEMTQANQETKVSWFLDRQHLGYTKP